MKINDEFNNLCPLSSSTPASGAETRLASKRKAQFTFTESYMDVDLSKLTCEEIADCFSFDTDHSPETLDDQQAENIQVARQPPSGKAEAHPAKIQKTCTKEFSLLSDMVQNLIRSQEAYYGDTKNCALLFPIQVKFAKIGFKCPIVNVPWDSDMFTDPPFIKFCNDFFMCKSVVFKKVNWDNRETFLHNVVGTLHGRWFPSRAPQDPHCTDTYYGLSSLCTDQCSFGLLLDVRGTIWEHLGKTIEVSEDEDPSNCEIISVMDTQLGCEVLMLAITRNVYAGDALILAGRHKHKFSVNSRGNGRKLKWFEDLRTPPFDSLSA
jgi:hypothetical protein